MKAEKDAVNIEVRSAMYFEVCKRSMEAMIIVNFETIPYSLVAHKGPADIYIYIYREREIFGFLKYIL